jgi:hypothetical protein
MTYWKACIYLCTAFVCSAGGSATSAQQLNAQQIQIIKDTAASICNTVKEAKGQKSETQLQGDVKAQLNGLIGKVVDIGGSGKGSLDREEFEGLSRDATATALEGDRSCRERLFNKMFDTLSANPSGLQKINNADSKEFSLAAGQSVLLTNSDIIMAVIGHPFRGNGPLMGIRLAGKVEQLAVGSSVNFLSGQETCSITLLEMLDKGGGKFYLKC